MLQRSLILLILLCFHVYGIIIELPGKQQLDKQLRLMSPPDIMIDDIITNTTLTDELWGRSWDILLTGHTVNTILTKYLKTIHIHDKSYLNIKYICSIVLAIIYHQHPEARAELHKYHYLRSDHVP